MIFFFQLQTALIWSEKKETVIFIEIYSIFSFCLDSQIISLIISLNVGVILIPQISLSQRRQSDYPLTYTQALQSHLFFCVV